MIMLQIFYSIMVENYLKFHYQDHFYDFRQTKFKTWISFWLRVLNHVWQRKF